MKKSIPILLFLFYSHFVFAQSSWTWLQGDAFTPRYGRYGTKGVADTANRPGARTGHTTWKDAAGDIWMFGGNGNSATGTGFLNDLWKYSSSTDTWTWISGDFIHDQPGVYGTKGVSSAGNMIRARSNPVSWMDAAGNLWLFGGETVRGSFASVPFYTNDLWKYTISTGLWTWMGGDTAYVVNSVYPGVYGTKGVAAASNKPGTRHVAAGWTDDADNLWLFGGYGASNPSIGALNDLWKYSIADGLWTWISGDATVNQTGKYETKGVASPATKPGSKIAPASWTDAAGNFWLFGGLGSLGTANDNKHANDLWTFSPSTRQWTWVSGDSTVNQPGIYGAKGVSAPANKPGARFASTGWRDTTGNFFIYSGLSNGIGVYNDLWKFSPSSSQWIWIWGDSSAGNQGTPVYGLKGVASDTTKPAFVQYGTRSWTDGSNNLWLSYGEILWKYAQTTGQWTWVRGDTSTIVASSIAYMGNYGAQGVPSPSNQPRARRFATTWTDASNQFWMYGGMIDSATSTAYFSTFNDLWKYDPSTRQWIWMHGDRVLNNQPVYGVQGVPSASSTPGARRLAASWTDADGNLWLFGGNYKDDELIFGPRYSDLWKYTPSTGQWTWIDGRRHASGRYENTPGVYGTRGTATAATYPGARYAATTWTDASGNMWMFGGDGYAGAISGFNSHAMYGKHNDLWKYAPSTNRWTWMSGDTTANLNVLYSSQPGVYGTKGVAGSLNKPGGRNGSAGWIDGGGNLWLFGGVTYPGGDNQNGTRKEAYFNDLWKYSPSTGLWTWVSGSNSLNQKGIYGTQNVPGPNTTPGARRYATSWTDDAGNLYLFGGNADSLGTQGGNGILSRFFNDLWRYSPTTGQWTWLSGDSAFNQPGTYGTLNVASAANKPGGRNGSIGWSDNKGNLWLYSGYGYPVSGYRILNDMMKFSLSSSLPVLFSSFRAQKQQQSVVLYWTTAQEQNSRSFIIERSADGIVYSRIGTVAAAGTSYAPSSYGFTDLAPLQGNNFYRLKEVDLDDQFMYSPIAKVWVGDEAAGFTIINNPAQRDVQVSLLLPSAQKVTLQVRDAGGRLWMTKAFEAGRGSNLLRLPVEALPKGTYFLQVVSPGLQGTKPFAKQ